MAGGGTPAGSDYPEYLKTFHNEWITLMRQEWDSKTKHSVGDYEFPDDVSYNPSDWFNEISTYEELRAYDTLSYFQKQVDTIMTFTKLVDPSKQGGYAIDLSVVSGLRSKAESLWAEIRDDNAVQATITKIVNAHAARLQERIEAEAIPKIEVGMRNANAGMSSAIYIAKAIVWRGFNRDVSDLSANLEAKVLELRINLLDTLFKLEQSFLPHATYAADLALKRTSMWFEHQRLIMSSAIGLADGATTQAQKYGVIKTDEAVRKATYRLELSKYVHDAVSSIAGASPINTGARPSIAGSVLSGAMSGAAAGAMTGSPTGPWGAGAGAIGGAVVGGVGGYLAAK